MPRHSEKSSLLERFDLSVEQLDYSFVRDCEDSKTLERIIRVLRSGEEGSYPHLLRYTEEKLAMVYPQSRVLETAQSPTRPHELPPQQLASLEADLAVWSAEIKGQEEELTRFEVIRAPLPPIRGSTKTVSELVGGVGARVSVPRLSTSDKENLLAQGRRHYAKGDFLQASLQYQKVLASDPLNPEALRGIAAIHDQPKGGGAVVQEIL
ncbi:sperm-associated antigen 1-like [Homarus americanus]|uniref:sperm-associated antigen 1-like n=1 Tax=Homarus americanus TaxID=6706 RepID=UPI001C44F592|nr:sperm-associated antigen 1-like [Homarus americanus]XP_042214518.1 sperm-associated antigen 1-like [Homarus americanus]XP_042214519.1 sperm-associated antigen 1-like [Homarus americanus]